MARSFNGTSDVISVADVAALNGASAYTISFWLQQPALAKGGGVSKAQTSSNRVGLYNFPGTNTAFFVFSNGTTNYGSCAAPNDLLWHHYCGVFDGSQATSAARAVLYLDGVAQSLSFNGTIPATSPNTAGTPLLFDEYSPGPTFMAGTLAEIVIHNLPLTANEVAALARGVLPRHVRPQSLAAYWPLWGLQSAEPDLSGNAQNGTLTGTAGANHAPVALWTRKARTIFDLGAGGNVTVNVGYSSANWTNPGVTVTAAVTVNAGPESASWTNPNAGFPAALTVQAGQVSAAWTNPAGSYASAAGLTLTAPSPAWSNPAAAANAAVTVNAGPESAAWNAPAITVSSSTGGVVVTVGPESAAWSAPPITVTVVAPCGRPALTFVALGGPCLFDNTEAITYVSKIQDGSYAAGISVPNALRRVATREDLTQVGILGKTACIWHVWAADLPPGTVCKLHDQLTSAADGLTWVVKRVEKQTFGTRYRLTCQRAD